MAGGNAIMSTQMAAATAATGSQGSRPAAKVDGGFQKLLDNKAQSDAGTQEAAGSKSKDNRPQETTDSKTPDNSENPADKTVGSKEETTGKENETLDDGSLEQAQTQAALLFQIIPETPAEAEVNVLEAVPEEIVGIMTEGLANSAAEAGIPAAAVADAAVQGEAVVTDTETMPVEEEAVAAVETLTEEPKARAEKEDTFQETEQNPTGQEANAAAGTQGAHTEEHVERISGEETQIPMERVQVTEPEEIPEKVMNQLLAKMVEGVREFEIQLEPQDLGKILIKVAFGKEAASVSIVCTEQRTMELMARNARDIGAIMSNNLGSPTTIVVEDKEPGYLEQHNQGNNQGNAEQNQEQQKEHQEQKGQERESLDFLQQLRLGLI